MMKQAVRDAFLGFTEPLEGKVLWMYPDVKNLVSTGIGNLIDPLPLALTVPFVTVDGPPATQEQIRDEWLRIKHLPLNAKGQTAAQLGHLYAKAFTTLRLTDAGLLKLVLGKLEQNDQILHSVFPDFEEWCADAQLATHSMSWACGAHFSWTWPKLSLALKTLDWRTAATECFLEEEKTISGLRPRNVANRTLYRNAAVVDERTMNPDELYYPADLTNDIVDPGNDPNNTT